jgi:predicted enzyme related to lactoylglutathione lyase
VAARDRGQPGELGEAGRRVVNGPVGTLDIPLLGPGCFARELFLPAFQIGWLSAAHRPRNAARRNGSTSPVAKRQAAEVTMKVLFVGVPVTDLSAAMGWYERLFGRAADIVPNESEVMWCIAENGWLYVIEDLERAGRTVVAISVSDLDGFVADLATRGISAGPIEAVGDAGRKANVVDSDGNVVSLIQVASGS